MTRLPEVMTTAEVAAALRVDRSTVRQWAVKGKLHALPTPGRNLRFRRDEVEQLLQPAERAS